MNNGAGVVQARRALVWVPADRMLDRLQAAMATLSENPKIGPARPDLAAGLRYFPVGRYVLLYREIPGGVEIVRCVHGARNLPGLSLRED